VGDILEFKRPISKKVIKSLIKLGYLERKVGRNEIAIKDALGRLKADLCRHQIVFTSDYAELANGGVNDQASPAGRASNSATHHIVSSFNCHYCRQQ
jgi:hypothetical protein